MQLASGPGVGKLDGAKAQASGKGLQHSWTCHDMSTPCSMLLSGSLILNPEILSWHWYFDIIEDWNSPPVKLIPSLEIYPQNVALEPPTARMIPQLQ